LDLELRAPVLAVLRLLDDTAQRMADPLQPVADAEHRHAERQDLRIREGRVGREHARRPAREHDAARLPGPDAVERQVAGVDLAVDAALADPARDELRVLTPEVQDQDAIAVGVGAHAAPPTRGGSSGLPA